MYNSIAVKTNIKEMQKPYARMASSTTVFKSSNIFIGKVEITLGV